MWLFVFQPNRPLMVAEFWPGWFDNWGDGHYKMDVEKTTTRVLNILKAGASINLYMFHGMAEYLWHIFRSKHKSIIFRTEVIRLVIFFLPSPHKEWLLKRAKFIYGNHKSKRY